MKFSPSITVYDIISPTDNWPYLAMQFLIAGSYGSGLTIVLSQGMHQVFIDCSDGDTPESVAGKIVAAWNAYNNNPLNKVGPVNDTLNVVNPMQPRGDMIQLITPAGKYDHFEFSYQEHETLPVVVKKSGNDWWWLLLIGGGLYAATRKGKKKKG